MKDNILNYHRWNSDRGRSRFGVSQHPISAKIDILTGGMIQDEQRTSGVKINSLINLAVKWYIEELDEARHATACGIHAENSEGVTKDQAIKYILNQLTDYEADKLKHICKGLRIPLEDIPLHLVREMLENYDDNPFLYL